jgi:malonyl-CoA O-methyltransferase
MSSIANAYNTWSQSYDTVENKTRDLDRKATATVLSGLDWNTVLELGCGTGKNTDWLAQRATQVLAVDFSAGMLDIAKEKITASNVSFQQADINKPWQFAQQSFDLICCNLMLEHIENLQPVFENATQALSAAGHFFISELHPFKQYTGSKARFEQGGETVVLDCYTHHLSNYFMAAKNAGMMLAELQEWFDEDAAGVPRLLTLLFQKK